MANDERLCRSAATARQRIAASPGRRLAGWTRDRQRAALGAVLSSMRPGARDALVHGPATTSQG
jgi:hypothetical protein